MLIQEILLELEGVVFQCDEVDVLCCLPGEVISRVEAHMAASQARRSKSNKIDHSLRCHIVELGASRGCCIGKWHSSDGTVHLDPYLRPAVYAKLREGV